MIIVLRQQSCFLVKGSFLNHCKKVIDHADASVDMKSVWLLIFNTFKYHSNRAEAIEEKGYQTLT